MKNLSDKELWGLCKKYGENARMWSRKFANLLPEVDKRKLWRKYGFYSIEEFAAKLAGLNHETTRRILNLDKKLEDKPFLRAQMEKQGWSKLRVVASVATKENDKSLAEKVSLLPKKALEVYITGMRGVPGDISEPVKEWSNLTFKVKLEVEFRLRKFQKKLENEKGETVPLGEVLNVLLEKAEKIPKAPRESKSKDDSRYLSAYKKYESDNGGRCAYPGCNKPHQVFHHPDRYSISENHDKIVPLCKEHHQMAHAGLIDEEEKNPIFWSLRTESNMNVADFKYQKYANSG